METPAYQPTTILAIAVDEYARLTGRQTPAEAAVAGAGRAVRGVRHPRARSSLLRPSEPQQPPQGIDSRSSQWGSTRRFAASSA